MTVLAGWQSFYAIVGSSAGALIGLQFVVLTLISSREVAPSQVQLGDAFATPTIVHFSAVLLLSAVVCAPWREIAGAAILLVVLGVAGAIYEIVVAQRMRRQILYKLIFEDWLCHIVLPFSAYATLAGSACAMLSHAGKALFGVAASALLLLFVSIHNAWDAVTYHVFVKK